MGARYAVIMAGGIGSRFWPLSRKNYPKQFIDVLGTGESLLQATWRRLEHQFEAAHILVVTHEDYGHLVKEQLPDLQAGNLLMEPMRKNTAPCIAYAAQVIAKRQPNATMGVFAADHLITREEAFSKTLNLAYGFAENSNAMVTLGIKPSRPDTGYGYIQKDGEEPSTPHMFRVKTFTEKPNEELAKSFLNSGEFLWNSGNFIWPVELFLSAYKTHQPEDAQIFEDWAKAPEGEASSARLRKAYSMVKNNSVDYAVMEKAEVVYVIEADLGWSDLGTWGSLLQVSQNEGTGNRLVGNRILVEDTESCMVHMPNDKLVVLQGVRDLIVAERDGVLLICHIRDEQKVKNIVNEVRMKWGDQFL